MRKVLILTLALIASVLGAAPVSAEPEPDNWIWQATGPVTSPTITGTIASNNDYDWYMIYAASQSQLAITLQTSTCGSDHSLTLYDSTGSQITYRYGSQTKPSTINYTTGIGTTRYFLRMRGSCIGAYRVDVSPAAALLGGSPMPNNTVKTGEPNENADQAQGPLAADVVYVGAGETSNDEDWFYFYASAAFNVTATSGDTCDGSITLYDKDRDQITYRYYDENTFDTIAHTPTSWQLHYLRVRSDCAGGAYRFSISPASAIQAGPAPAPTAPAPMTGLAYRKTKKTVVVYWSAISGATGYQVRMRKGSKWGAWKSTANTWKSYKRKKLPKVTKVRARATNAVGSGAAQTIRVRR